jgi:antitoxin VapB
MRLKNLLDRIYCFVAKLFKPKVAVWDSFFVNGSGVSDDFMNERASQQQSDRDDF